MDHGEIFEKENHKYICVYTWYICLLLLNSEFILGRLLQVNYDYVTVLLHINAITGPRFGCEKEFRFAIFFLHRWTMPEENEDGNIGGKVSVGNGENVFNVNSDLLSSSSSLDVTH